MLAIGGDCPYIVPMKEPTANQAARTERMRLATETGAQARADIENRDIQVRKNMERLRALRLAKEAEEASKPKPETAVKKKSAKASAASKAAAPKNLADWVAKERAAGRRT